MNKNLNKTKSEIGRLGENVAAHFLKKSKYKLCGRNVHISHNEIDIIALSKKQKVIVFVEVKTRSVGEDLYSPFGSPASAVNKEKQKRTIVAAREFLHQNPNFFEFQPRFDVIEIYLDKATSEIVNINHIENAFSV